MENLPSTVAIAPYFLRAALAMGRRIICAPPRGAPVKALATVPSRLPGLSSWAASPAPSRMQMSGNAARLMVNMVHLQVLSDPAVLWNVEGLGAGDFVGCQLFSGLL